MKLAVIILAAGSSTRMGRPKQLLPWGEGTLLSHAIDQARSIDGAVVVVLGAHYTIIKEHLSGVEVRTVFNAAYRSGLGSSIATGISAVKSEPQAFTAALFMLVDQPSVDAALLRRIVDAHLAEGDKIIATAYPRRLGVPALFPEAFFPQLLTLGGDAGAGELLNAIGSGVLTISPPSRIYDIDTPEDYHRYEGNQEHR